MALSRILDDPSEELLIARGRAADDYVGSKEHWLHGYVLRHDIETPCFLREFMTTILDVGRSPFFCTTPSRRQLTLHQTLSHI